MNSSVRLVETNFLSSRNSIVSFRALLKFLKFGRINLRKTLFLLVETDFLATRSQFFPFFRYSFLLVKGIFFFSRKHIFERIFHSVWWRRIFCIVEAVFFYLLFFFLQLENFTEISGNKFNWKDFVPVERDFPPSGNCFL